MNQETTEAQTQNKPSLSNLMSTISETFTGLSDLSRVSSITFGSRHSMRSDQSDIRHFSTSNSQQLKPGLVSSSIENLLTSSTTNANHTTTSHNPNNNNHSTNHNNNNNVTSMSENRSVSYSTNLTSDDSSHPREEFQSLYMNRNNFIRAQPTLSSSYLTISRPPPVVTNTSPTSESSHQSVLFQNKSTSSGSSPRRLANSKQEIEKSILQDSIAVSLSMAERRSFEQQIRELERRNAELSELIVVTNKNEQHAKSAASNESELNRQLREINQRLSTTVSNQIHQMNSLDQELASQKSILELKQSRITELEKMCEEVKKEKNDEGNELKKKLKRAVLEIQKLRQIQNDSKVDEYQHNSSLQQKENTIIQLKQTIESVKFSNDNLEERVTKLTNEISTLRQENMKLADDAAKAKVEKEQTQHQLDLAQAEFKEFEKEFDKIKTKYDEFLVTYTSMLDENKKLKKKVASREKRIENLQGHIRAQSRDQEFLYEQIEVLKQQQQELIQIQDEKKKGNKQKHRHSSEKYEPVVNKFEQKGDARGSKSPVYLVSPQKEQSSPPTRRLVQKRPSSLSPFSPSPSSASSDRRRLHSRLNVKSEQLHSPPEKEDLTNNHHTHTEGDSSHMMPSSDSEYLKKRLLTERKRVELKNIEIAGLKELLYQTMKSNERMMAAQSSSRTRQNEFEDDDDHDFSDDGDHHNGHLDHASMGTSSPSIHQSVKKHEFR